MDYSLTSEQQALQQMAADFVKREITPQALEYDKSGEFPAEAYRKYAELGLHCAMMPEEYGGPGLDCLSSVLVTEQIAKGCAGFAAIIAANGLATYPVLLAGTAAQKQKFFDIMSTGALASFCLTEPDAGSDAGSVKTVAVRDGDEYVINGSKRFITNGSMAGIYTVIASIDRSKGVKGLCAFLVEGDRAGLSSGKHEDKMGIRCSDTSEVFFDNVRIPAENMLGGEGEGFKLAMQTLEVGRSGCAAMAVGVAQAAFEYALDYSQKRVQFGKPISANQGIQFMLADMATEIEAARQLTYYSAYLRDTNDPSATKVAAMAKTYASDAAMKITTDAVQIYGGYGYIKEYPMEKLMRDAKIMQIIEGTNQIQRKVVVGQLMPRK